MLHNRNMSWCCPKWWQWVPFSGNGGGGRTATTPHYSSNRAHDVPICHTACSVI